MLKSRFNVTQRYITLHNITLTILNFVTLHCDSKESQCEPGLRLSNSNEFDCTRLAPALSSAELYCESGLRLSITLTSSNVVSSKLDDSAFDLHLLCIVIQRDYNTVPNVSFSSAKWEGTYSSSLLTVQNLLEVMSLKFHSYFALSPLPGYLLQCSRQGWISSPRCLRR